MCGQAGDGHRGAGGVQGAGAAADPRGTAGPVRPAIGQGGAGKGAGKERGCITRRMWQEGRRCESGLVGVDEAA